MAKNQLKVRSGRRIHFKNNDMDFYLMCILANERFFGSSYGEALATASSIKENSPESWSNEWIALGARYKARAERSLDQNHLVSAREAFLRAYTYLRWGGHGLSVRDPRRAENYQTFVSCFQNGVRLLDIKVEPIQVPWKLRGDDISLPGYFMSSDDSRAKRPTIVIINGGEMYPEDQFFWGGAAAVRRGYNVVSITYEGQPAPTIIYPDWEPIGPDDVNDLPDGPFGFMVDYVIDRPETDPNKVIGMGFSGGSYHIMRQASIDQRISALLLAPPIFDPLALVDKEFPKSLQNAPEVILNALTSFARKVNPFTGIAMEGLLGMARVESLTDFLEMMKQTIPVDPASISCPTLSLVGEGDSDEEQRQCRVFFESSGSTRKQKVIFRHTDGASAHCQVDNFGLLEQIAFDWLDETLSMSDR